MDRRKENIMCAVMVCVFLALLGLGLLLSGCGSSKEIEKAGVKIDLDSLSSKRIDLSTSAIWRDSSWLSLNILSIREYHFADSGGVAEFGEDGRLSRMEGLKSITETEITAQNQGEVEICRKDSAITEESNESKGVAIIEEKEKVKAAPGMSKAEKVKNDVKSAVLWFAVGAIVLLILIWKVVKKMRNPP